MTVISIETFRATKSECADLGVALQEDTLMGVSGFLYMDLLYIANSAEPAKGKYYLLLDRDDWISDDLADLESKLYDWAVADGFCDISEAHTCTSLVALIGEEFATLVKEGLSEAELDGIRTRNKDYDAKYPTFTVCATHDIMDANMPMNEAFKRFIGRDVDGNNESDCTLWGKAWEYARNKYFLAK